MLKSAKSDRAFCVIAEKVLYYPSFDSGHWGSVIVLCHMKMIINIIVLRNLVLLYKRWYEKDV